MAITQVKILQAAVLSGVVVGIVGLGFWVQQLISQPKPASTIAQTIICDRITTVIPDRWSIVQACDAKIASATISDPFGSLQLIVELPGEEYRQEITEQVDTPNTVLRHQVILPNTLVWASGTGNSVIDNLDTSTKSYNFVQQRSSGYSTAIQLGRQVVRVRLQATASFGPTLYSVFRGDVKTILDSLEQK
jgi:hypothetical protein